MEIRTYHEDCSTALCRLKKCPLKSNGSTSPVTDERQEFSMIAPIMAFVEPCLHTEDMLLAGLPVSDKGDTYPCNGFSFITASPKAIKLRGSSDQAS